MTNKVQGCFFPEIDHNVPQKAVLTFLQTIIAYDIYCAKIFIFIQFC